MRLSFICLLFPIASLCRAQDPCDVSVNITPPTCPGDADGSITVVGNGGPFTYFWGHDATLEGPTANDLETGPYSVVVFDTAGCISLIDTVVGDPVVEPLGTMTITNLSCAGTDDGTVIFTVDPGPYTWEWLHDPNETEDTLTGLGPGDYTVLISGGECPSFVTASLGDPDILILGETIYCPSDPPLLITQPEWGFQPDIYEWTTGDSTASINVVPSLAGTVEVTATDTSTGCVATGDVFLTVLPSPEVALSAPDSACQRVATSAHTVLSTADSLVWRWGADGFSNEEDPIISFDGSLWQPISLQGFDAFGCGNAPVVDSVYVRPRLPALFTATQVPCTPMADIELASIADSCAFFIGDSLVTHECMFTFRWDFVRYHEYELTFYSTRPDRCDDTLSVLLNVRTEPTLFLPNAFTPNGDGVNDTWPGLVDIPERGFQVQLFDRWGSNLWTTTDTQEKWDGSTHPDGVYVYTMRMRDPCEPTQEIARNGFVTLLR